jgi:hypothetical protein
VPIEGQWMAVAERAIAPQSLTQKAANEMALLGEARDARPCAGHPRLCSIKQERRGWPGRSPAMTKKRIVFKLLGKARKSWLHFRSGSQDDASAEW